MLSVARGAARAFCNSTSRNQTWTRIRVISAPIQVRVPPFAIRGLSSLPPEPTLASQGLCGWTPTGMAQTCLEYLHVTYDLPWWTCIVIGTLVVRIAIFPLYLKTRRDATHLHNNMPGLVLLQTKMAKARANNDAVEANRCAQELMQYMREKKVNPFKGMVGPLMQLPFFITFFTALRGMASLPVESMKEGGFMWFTDLTVSDPLLLLPIITSATLLIMVEVGADMGKLPSQQVKYVMRVMPFIMLPIVVQFPAAVLCYWTTTNFISLIQVGIFKIPGVQEYFQIPKTIPHPPEMMKVNNFMGGAKESWTNVKISSELSERNEVKKIIERGKKNKEHL